MRTIFVSFTVVLVLVTACSDETTANGQGDISTTQSPEATTTPTTGEFGNTIEQPAIVPFDADALERKGFVDFDLVVGCGGDLFLSDSERLLPDRRFAATGSDGYVRSDFPDHWQVFIYNEGGHDGPDAAILNVRLERESARSYTLTEIDSGDLVFNLTVDPTPPEEWEFCG